MPKPGFLVWQSGAEQASFMQADGKGQRVLPLKFPRLCGEFRFSRDGKKVAYGREVNIGVAITSAATIRNIFVMNAKGKALKPVSHAGKDNAGIDNWNSDPIFSSDGQRVVWVSTDQNYPGANAIHMANADGSHRRQVVHYSNASGPCLSPDSKTLVFSAAPRNLTNDPLAFEKRHMGSEIWKLTVGASKPVRLTENDRCDNQPSFSPDGRQIVFTSERAGNSDIYVMTAQEKEPRQLTLNAGNNTSPEFSLDGKFIAFVSDRDGNAEIYVMNTDGANQQRLTFNDTDDANPHWIKSSP